VSEPTRQRVVAIAVYGDRAAAAMEQVTALLGSAGVAPEETQEMLAVIQAGAIEGAQSDVLDLAGRPPEGSTPPLVQGWGAAVRAAGAELAHIADRTVVRGRSAAGPRRWQHSSPPPPLRSPTLRRSGWSGSWRRLRGSSSS
jgi:hypothetical protein